MITSASNQKMKQLVQLKQKAKVRKEQGVFLTEGLKLFLEAPKDWVREVYVSESFYIKYDQKESLKQYQFEVVSDDIFAKVSDTVTPQGILCVLKQPQYEKEFLWKKQNPLLILLEDIQDPGNLGTIFRAAEGAGVDAIVMTKETVDVFSPKVIRSTMGSIYRMPFYYTDGLEETIKELKSHQIKVYAAHLEGSISYDQPAYQKASAFLIGNEGNGLKEVTAKLADTYIKIPMEGEVESLNAAIATTILMYEASRQRRTELNK